MDELKGLYADKIDSWWQPSRYSVNEDVAEDGVQFIVARGAAPITAALEQSLDELRGLYADKGVVPKDGGEFIVTRGAAPSMVALEQSLSELEGLYADKQGYSVNE